MKPPEEYRWPVTVKLAGNEHRGSVFIRGDMMEVTSEFGSSKSKVLKGELKLTLLAPHKPC